MNQTFQSEAVRIQLSRRLYQGTWNVTSTNISLISATALQHSSPVLQNVIQNNRFSLQQYYSPVVAEFNWAWRNNLSNWVPPSSRMLNETLGYFPRVNLIPALAAAITWSRMVNLDGAERYLNFTQGNLSPSDLPYDRYGYIPAYWKDSSEISTVKSVVTLQRSWVLAAIIVFHPILTVLSLLGKTLLYSTPIGEGFGTISLMAGIERGTLDVLRGAALTGELSRDIKVRFITKPSEDLLGTGDRLSIQLDGSKLDNTRRSDCLEPRKLYG